MTHLIPVEYLSEYHYKVRNAADRYDPLSGMNDICMERNKMVLVGTFTEDSWEDGIGTDAQLRDSIFGDYVTSSSYSQHHPTMFPIEDLDDRMAESIISRDNQGYSAMYPQAAPLLRSKADLQAKYIKDRCLAVKFTHPGMPQGKDDSVEDLENKFRFILGVCKSKTNVIQMYAKCAIVFDKMKEIQQERAQAQTSLFPNEKKKDLSAM